MENPIITKIKAELAAFEAKKQAFVTELRKEFPTMFNDIFATAPNLKSVSWTQYTPYFNDGDTCYFSAHVVDLRVNGVDRYDYDEDEDVDKYAPCIYNILKTVDDVANNKKLAVEVGYTWYEKCKIGDRGLFPNPHYDAALHAAVDNISEVLSAIPSEFLKDLFGDHTMVTINSDGSVDTEDYDHD